MAKFTESGCSKSGQFNPMLLSTPYGMVWYGMVWCGVVWYGTVDGRYGTVRHDIQGV